MIMGHGSTSAKVMLVSDGGSVEDVASGYAITGYAENIYRGFSRANNLHLDEFWRTSLIKERINLSDWEANVPLVNDEYKKILENEIKEINPNVIVPLSELSFQFLTNLKGIHKFRGSVLPSRGDISNRLYRIIPILGVNPYLNNEPELKTISEIDFGKVARNQFNDGPIKEIGNCWIAKSATSLRTFIERHYSKSDFVVFDIETFGNIPSCISFCFDGIESVCVPLIDYLIPLDDRVLLLHEVAKLLAAPIKKVNQNIKFDWKKLEGAGFYVNNVGGDTQVAAGTLYSEFPKNLGFLTSIYTEMPYFKDEGKDFDPSSHTRERLYLYNAKDSLAAHQIYTQQLGEMENYGVREVYDKLIQVMPTYKWMEETGILIDQSQRLRLVAKYENLLEIQKMKLNKLVGRVVNARSPKVMGQLIFEELGFKKIRGVKGTDEDSLEILAWMGHCASPRDGNEIIHTIVAIRKIYKVIEYLETYIHPDGRMRCDYNITGTETGRTTAGKTTDYYIIFERGKVKRVNLGRSFQTISKHGFTVEGETYGKDLRSIFVPTKGFDFVECDLSQAEARVDAVLARDFKILEVFDSPTGIHRLTGSWVFNCLPEEIKKGLTVNAQGVGEDRYHIAKTVRHAGERNMREDRLMIMIHKPINECIRILKTFHQNQPNIREVFHKEIQNIVKESHRLVAPNGRHRQFFGRIDDHTINEAISILPQAIVGDQLKFAFIPTYKECSNFARPVMEAHDGHLAEVKKGYKEKFALEFKKNVEVPIDFNKCSLSRDFKLVIPMEAEWSDTNWKELKHLDLSM